MLYWHGRWFTRIASKPTFRTASTVMASHREPLTLENCRERLARLTPRQGDCLRLVAKGYQTKEIAIQLNISESRVNKHIEAARAVLGARTRGEAGRIFAAWEAARFSPESGGYSMGAQSMGLPETDEFVSPAPVATNADAPVATGGSLAEGQVPYSTSASISSLFDHVPLRMAGRERNDLSFRKTLITIVIMAAAALVGIGSAISLLLSLSSHFNH